MRKWIWIISCYFLLFSAVLFAAEEAIVFNIVDPNHLFYAQLAPIHYVGLLLVFLGITFMIAEVFIGTFGIVGIAGVIAFIIGSIILFDTRDPTSRVMLTLILSMSVVALTFFFITLFLAIKSHKKGIVSGQEGLIGQEGMVIIASKEQLRVRVLGEIWNAKSIEDLNVGQIVKVTHVHGLELTVVPIQHRMN